MIVFARKGFTTTATIALPNSAAPRPLAFRKPRLNPIRVIVISRRSPGQDRDWIVGPPFPKDKLESLAVRSQTMVEVAGRVSLLAAQPSRSKMKIFPLPGGLRRRDRGANRTLPSEPRAQHNRRTDDPPQGTADIHRPHITLPLCGRASLGH